MSNQENREKCARCDLPKSEWPEGRWKQPLCRVGRTEYESHVLSLPPQKEEYHHIDHAHCWSSKNPPCGQRIKHFECCLCKKVHPEVHQVIDREREKLGKEIIELANKDRKFAEENIINQALRESYLLGNEHCIDYVEKLLSLTPKDK